MSLFISYIYIYTYICIYTYLCSHFGSSRLNLTAPSPRPSGTVECTAFSQVHVLRGGYAHRLTAVHRARWGQSSALRPFSASPSTVASSYIFGPAISLQAKSLMLSPNPVFPCHMWRPSVALVAERPLPGDVALMHMNESAYCSTTSKDQAASHWQSTPLEPSSSPLLSGRPCRWQINIPPLNATSRQRSRIRRVSHLLSNVSFLQANNWWTDARSPITTFRRNLCSTWCCACVEACNSL